MADIGPISMDFMYWGKKYNATFKIKGLHILDAWDKKKERCIGKMKDQVLAAGGEWREEYDNPDFWPGKHYRVGNNSLNREQFEELKAQHKNTQLDDDDKVSDDDEERDELGLGSGDTSQERPKKKKRKEKRKKGEKLFG